MHTETIALVVAIVLIVAGAAGVVWNELRHKRNRVRHAYRMPPEYFEALAFMLGDQTDRALEIFLELAGRDNDSVELHFALGNLFRRKGEIERATLIHQNLIARPTLSREQRNLALKELGHDYLRAGLYDRAENIFGDLIDLKAHQVDAAKSLILIYEQQQDWEQAAAMRRRLEWLQGSSERKVIALYYCEIAERARVQGDEKAAREALAEARRNDRDCARMRLAVAKAAAGAGDTRRAIREYRELLGHEPGLAEIVLPTLANLFAQGAQAEEFDAIVGKLLRDKSDALLPIAVAGLRHESLRCPQVLAAIEREMEHLISPVSGYDSWPLKDTCQVREIMTWLLSDWLEKRPLYQCSRCGFGSHELYWHCPGCRAWDSVRMRGDVFPVPGGETKGIRLPANEST